jgi:hypothetical protein
MSHIVTAGACILDLDALAEAAANKGAQFDWNRTRFQSFSPGLCEHAIKLLDNPYAYEVGIVKHATVPDAYDFAFDNYGVHGRALESAFGIGLTGLKHEYGAVLGERFARSQGFMAERVEDTGQRVELRIHA